MKTRHKFWIDGTKTEIDNYHNLAEWLIKNSMEYNKMQWDIEGNQTYINDWFKYYLSLGNVRPSFYNDVAFDIFTNRDLCHKKPEQKMNKRNSRFVVFTMAKILEKFNSNIEL